SAEYAVSGGRRHVGWTICAALAIPASQAESGWLNRVVGRKTMRARPWLILAAVALARIGFGYQYQTVASLGPELMRQFEFDYTTLGTLIGAFMMLGAFVAIPVGLLTRKFGDRLVLGGGLTLMVLGPIVSAVAVIV